MQRTTKNFPRMKDHGWARRNRPTLAIRATTRAFRKVGLAADVAADSFGNFFVTLAGLSGNQGHDRG